MHIEAKLSGEELRTAVDALLPMKILLDADAEAGRHLALGRAVDSRIVEHRGLEVTCAADLCWSSMFEFHLDVLRFTIVPAIEARDARPVLAFRIEVQKSDFAGLPGFLDAGVARVIDSALDSRPAIVEIGRLLSHSFPLPETVEPSRRVVLFVRDATCVVDRSGFRLGATIDVGLAS